MSKQTFAAKIRKNLTDWHPKLTAELKAAGTFEANVQARAKMAQERMVELMNQGYRETEAEEVVNSELVHRKPEADAEVSPEERRELDALEKEYQATR